MSINRAPFNALIDDDGSNTAGSIWNKNALKNVLLDPIDEALRAGTLTMVNPGAPVDHRQWQLFVAGDGRLFYLARNDAGSVDEVAYPLILSRTGDVQIYGNYIEKNRLTPMGHWVDVPFNPANFGASGGTWTVGAPAIISNRYTLIGKTLHWQFYISWFSGSNVVAGAATALIMTIPGGFVAAGVGANPIAYAIDGVGAVVPVYAGAAGAGYNYVGLQRNAGGNFAAGAFGAIAALTIEIT